MVHRSFQFQAHILIYVVHRIGNYLLWKLRIFLWLKYCLIVAYSVCIFWSNNHTTVKTVEI